ncbi:MAG: hydroxyacylglutathione hydrolase [Burkholderiales bacterium]|jgi:hydroxyacylglutathione hydrolase|nr:hydroxyacylglutathione hydrolase [Burkholderiales bacterium]
MNAIIPIPALGDNYIWLIHNHREAIAFDAGASAPLLRILSEQRLDLIALFSTHHHQDHVGGNEAVAQHFRVPVYAPSLETIPAKTHALTGGETLMFPSMNLRITPLHVPGHTRGHLAYYCEHLNRADNNPPLLFCGDTLFSLGCGRIFEGSPEEMFASLKKLAALPDATLCCCGHEYTAQNLRFARWLFPNDLYYQTRAKEIDHLRAHALPTVPTTLKEERLHNPFLRVDDETLRHRVRVLSSFSCTTPVDTFAALRLLKDQFKSSAP